LKGNYG
jgi:hypothetical protein